MLFKEIVGNTEIKNRLIRTVLNSRVSHAQLFLGVEGTEKLAMAIAYSQFISCENKQYYDESSELIADSCGHCSSCVKYQKLVHPDLHFIFPVATTKKSGSKPVSDMFLEEWREALIDSNYYLSLNEWYEKIGIENKQGRIGVDDANNIIKTLGLRSYESEYKVMIIWMVEKLYHAAAPKLLKILEEPPEKTLFILISENQDALLKTILSRVQILKFKAHPDELIREYLKRNFQLEEKRREEIVYLSDGLFSKMYKQVLGEEDDLAFFTHFREMMLYGYQNNFVKMREKANDLSGLGREKIKQLLQYGMRITRLCLLHDLGNHELVRSANDELDFVRKFSRFVNRNNAENIYGILENAEYHITRNVNAKIVLLDTMLKASVELRKHAGA